MQWREWQGSCHSGATAHSNSQPAIALHRYMVQLTTDDVFTFPLDLYLPTNHPYINGMCSYPQCTMQHNAMCWCCVKCHRHPRKVHLPPLHILMSHAPLLSVARQSDRTIEYLEGGGIVSLQLHAAS